MARFRPDGSVVYSTYLGGDLNDAGTGIAVDPGTGDAVIAGYTGSSNFPTANPWQAANAGGADAFVARFNADGNALIFSTYLGGSGSEEAYGMALDPTTGDILVAGTTNSKDFPTVNAVQPNYAGGQSNAFVARFSS